MKKEAQWTCCWIIGNREGIWPCDSQKTKILCVLVWKKTEWYRKCGCFFKLSGKGIRNPQSTACFYQHKCGIITLEILSCYVCRWPIEVFFRQCKTMLALGTYQTHSSKGIQRYWLLWCQWHIISVLQALDDISLSRKDINWFAVPFSRKSINICFNVQNTA